MSELRTCPIEGCENMHPTKMLMCKRHWRRVPKDLQDRVYSTARRMWRGEGTMPWVEASDAAVAAVEMKLADADRQAEAGRYD